jgi:hypothetical protein
MQENSLLEPAGSRPLPAGDAASRRETGIVQALVQRRLVRLLAASLLVALAARLIVAAVPAEWLSAYRARAVPVRHVANPGPPPVLTNGRMTEGVSTPAGWTLRGQARLSRDLRVFHSAPASLRLECRGTTPVEARTRLISMNGPFLVQGFFRTQGDLRGSEIAVSVEAWGKRQAWMPATTLPGAGAASRDWKPFARRVVLPSMACDEYLVVKAQGTGKIWLDDLSVTRIGE